MHFAAHGHTAAEIIAERADGTWPFMGMQASRPGGFIRKGDASVAKNYLVEDELQILHRIVSFYIEYAELQALERRPMTMRAWIDKLDGFLKLSGRELLDHAGTVSAEAAKAKAEAEYERYQAFLATQPRAIDTEFEKVAKQLENPPPETLEEEGEEMTNPFTESVVEEAALEWCGALGYQVVFEPTIAPGSRAWSE